MNPSPWRPLLTDLIIIVKEVNHRKYFVQPKDNMAREQVPWKTLQPPRIDPSLLSQFYHRASYPIPPIGTTQLLYTLLGVKFQSHQNISTNPTGSIWVPILKLTRAQIMQLHRQIQSSHKNTSLEEPLQRHATRKSTKYKPSEWDSEMNKSSHYHVVICKTTKITCIWLTMCYKHHKSME